jgi:hypothetical protein
MRTRLRTLATATLTALAFALQSTHAASVRDQVLSRADYFATSACQIVKIGFNFPTRYVAHYPFDHGTELRIEVDTLTSGRDGTQFDRKREALEPPREFGGLLAAITYEGNVVPRPILTLTFRQSVAFKVAQGGDFRSLIVAVARPQGSGVCEPEFPTTE